EGLLQSLENVGDSNVSKPFLEQDEVTVSAFAVGRGLVIEAGEVIGCEPVSKGFGRLGVSPTMTINVDHADGQGSALPPISPEVEGGLPSKVVMEVAVGRCAHVAERVVIADQLLVGIPTDAIILCPAEAVGADQFSQVGANWIFDSFGRNICESHYYI